MKEVKSLEAAREFMESEDFGEAAYQDIDLRPVRDLMTERHFGGSIFLGCNLAPETVCQVASAGAVIIPHIEDFLFPVHRSRLYSPRELFDGIDLEDSESHLKTLDHRVYSQYVNAGRQSAESIRVTLARRLHDHSITEALDHELVGKKVVAIMGGHSLERQSEVYRTVARISRRLTREGFLLVSGGGPGAMEATHVGAFFATRSEEVMYQAIDRMSTRPEGAKPNTEYADKDWLHRAWRVFEDFAIPEGDEESCKSIGIPTWLYGHEPPAVFATHIAKYFANSVREDGLLMIANHGIVFAPGSAGTTQEIFQDAAQNHYFVADGQCSPMILFGEKYWTETRPVWPLLEKVAKGQRYGEILTLTDSIDTVVRKLLCYRPELYRKD